MRIRSKAIEPSHVALVLEVYGKAAWDWDC